MKKKNKTNRKCWGPEEIEYLRKNFHKKILKELSSAMGRSVSSIRIAAHALEITEGH
jgi:hypothetical protein